MYNLFFVLLKINIPFVIHGLLFNFFSFLDFLLRGACLLNVMLKISTKSLKLLINSTIIIKYIQVFSQFN